MSYESITAAVPVVGERTGMATHETDRVRQEKGLSSSLMIKKRLSTKPEEREKNWQVNILFVPFCGLHGK